MYASLRELKNEPRVDGAETQFAALRTIARAGNVVEQPLEFGARKIGVDDEAGFLRESGRESALAQRIA